MVAACDDGDGARRYRALLASNAQVAHRKSACESAQQCLIDCWHLSHDRVKRCPIKLDHDRNRARQ